jgi:DNA-binding Lrp family transcriptional regulator
MLQRLADAGLVKGKTVGIDATTLEANAALRSIVRRDTGESYQDFLTKLAQASGIETPTRADLARIDRTRKKKGSNDDWTHPHDPDAKIMRRVHLRGHTNIRERLLIHAGGFNFGLLMRRLIGVGTPRGCKGGSEPPWPSWCSFAPSGSP